MEELSVAYLTLLLTLTCLKKSILNITGSRLGMMSESLL